MPKFESDKDRERQYLAVRAFCYEYNFYQEDMGEFSVVDYSIKNKKGRKGRYAPRAVAEALTPQQRAAENRKKREGKKKGRQHVPRTKAGKKVYRRIEGR